MFTSFQYRSAVVGLEKEVRPLQLTAMQNVWMYLSIMFVRLFHSDQVWSYYLQDDQK